MSCVQTMSRGGVPPANQRRNGCSNRAKWMTSVPAASRARGFVGQLAPGDVRFHAVLRHPFGDVREARDGGRNALPVRKSDEPRLCLCRRRCQAEDLITRN